MTMNLNNSVPKISKIAILLVVAFVLNLLYSALSTSLLKVFFGPADYGEYLLNVSIASIVQFVLAYLVNIIIAVWAYREAKKQNEQPWIWAALALFFGLIAAVTFYLVLVVRELRELRTELKGDVKNDQA